MRTAASLGSAVRALSLLAAALLAAACSNPPPPKHPWSPPDPDGAADDVEPRESHRDLWWREARFGLFVHCGLYALTEGRWSDCDRHGEWIRDTARIPEAEYRALAQHFDAGGFDPRLWARLSR